MQDNSYAIYQVKTGQDYHMLRFASLEELKRDGLRLRRDVHKVLDVAEDSIFPDKAAAEQFLRDEGFLGRRAESKRSENCCYGFYGIQIKTGVSG